MCRTYKDYVRCCYKTKAKGLRIPKAQAVWNRSHTHLLVSVGPRDTTYALMKMRRAMRP